MTRKRPASMRDPDSDSEKENAPKKKRQVKGASTKAKVTPASKSKATTKPKVGAAQKLYDDTTKAITKGVKALDAKVKKMSPNSRSITTDNYAKAAAKHLSVAKTLIDTDDVAPAFNLLVSMADASHTDLERSIKMCGYGDGDAALQKLDKMLLEAIEKRAASQPSEALAVEDFPDVRKRFTPEDAEVGRIKSSYGMNKQQWNAARRQGIEWEQERAVERRERREGRKAWAAAALEDLKVERDYLSAYGVDQYFVGSISKLEMLVSGKNEAQA